LSSIEKEEEIAVGASTCSEGKEGVDGAILRCMSLALDIEGMTGVSGDRISPR